MARRLLLGLVLGCIVGGLAAVGLIAGLKMSEFAGTSGAFLAYAVAALTGVVTGLVAGKPIWASGAKIEAGLKAVFGALLGAGLMFALRQWGSSWMIDLTVLGAGHGHVAELPGASLPLVAAVLGALFELDNTGDRGVENKGGQVPGSPAAQRPGERKRIAPPATAARSSARVAGADGSEDADAATAEAKRAKR